jgi:hypothetical protein
MPRPSGRRSRRSPLGCGPNVRGANDARVRGHAARHLSGLLPLVTRLLGLGQDLVDEGYLVTPEIIARLSPYKTEHINRFGHYELRFDHVPPPVTEELRLSPALSTRELERG